MAWSKSYVSHLQGAATARIHCHDSRATMSYHIAGCKNYIRHIENRFSLYFIFFVLLMQFGLWRAAAFVSFLIDLFDWCWQYLEWQWQWQWQCYMRDSGRHGTELKWRADSAHQPAPYLQYTRSPRHLMILDTPCWLWRCCQVITNKRRELRKFLNKVKRRAVSLWRTADMQLSGEECVTEVMKQRVSSHLVVFVVASHVMYRQVTWHCTRLTYTDRTVLYCTVCVCV